MKNKHIPWNKGKLTGQKPALKLKEIWSIRTRLQISHNISELALFNMAIDSKLRGCDLVKLRVSDISHGLHISKRAMIVQQKTGRSVQFELTKQTRDAAEKLIKQANLSSNDYLFKSQFKKSKHLSTRQYARIVKKWVLDIGLDPYEYGTHSLRRTKVSLIYRQTKNIRAIQLLLGHAKIESTVRYLGFEVDDALEMSEHMDI
ncbi:MAG: tyrosine-type recombinase/integrase [Gammaproteobacteria bacterium]|nr:tyrosine-type recombinase/integrase [Gammaproteobacteria bacterium]